MTIKTNRSSRPNKIAVAKLWALMVCSIEGSSWLQSLLLPCPFKYAAGFDCPGCGFQRSLLALFQGHWLESYHLYPPTVPLLIVLVYASLRGVFDFDKRGVVMKVVAVACGWFVIGVYLLKLWHGHNH